MRSMYINTALYSIFIGKREDAREINAVDLNDLNIYVRDVVAVFRLFC